MASSRMNKHLKKAQIKELKEKVIGEVERIQNKLAMATTALEVNGAGDEVDNANQELLQRTELRFSTREGLYLKKLRKTQELLETEEYGMCNDCGAEISFTRLKARPTSTMCITCKEEAERDELQSFSGRKSKSLSSSMNA